MEIPKRSLLHTSLYKQSIVCIANIAHRNSIEISNVANLYKDIWEFWAWTSRIFNNLQNELIEYLISNQECYCTNKYAMATIMQYNF